MYQLDKIKVTNSDERRDLTSLFNGGFQAKQIKIIKVKRDSILGNHYHNYREMFYVLKGQAYYTLENIETKEHKGMFLDIGDRLIIDSKIAHKAFLKTGTITIEATESEYISPEFNDKRYEVK
jgi:cupin superfamily acireductone dioxygenase involved in methionine salvage